MNRQIKKGALVSGFGGSLGNLTTKTTKAESTSNKHNRIADVMHGNSLHCTALHSILSRTSSNTGNNLGGLFETSRRLIAMPFMAFSFCALSRTHGVSASICFDGHANWESLTGLLFSVMTVRQPDWCCPPTLGGVVAFINK
mgnify:FL=1